MGNPQEENKKNYCVCNNYFPACPLLHKWIHLPSSMPNTLIKRDHSTGPPALLPSLASEPHRRIFKYSSGRGSQTVCLAVCHQHWGVCVHLLSCVWLFCDPINCSLPGSSVHGIFQTRVLEWVAISFSRGSSWAMDYTHNSHISCNGRWILYHWATWGLCQHN